MDGLQLIGQAHQLAVLREGFDVMLLHDAGKGQGGWRAADGQTHQLAVLRESFYMTEAQIKVDGEQLMAKPINWWYREKVWVFSEKTVTFQWLQHRPVNETKYVGVRERKEKSGKRDR